MYPIYFNYAFFFVLVQSLIVFVEFFVKFKNPTSLKITILFFLFTVVLYCLGNIYINFYGYSRWFVETPAVLLAISTITIFSLLYELKINRKVIIYGLIAILIQQSVSLLVNPSLVDYNGLKNFRTYIRLLLTILAIGIVYNLFLKIVKKFKSENIYFQQLKTWTRLFVLDLCIILAANIIKLFLGPNNLFSRALVLLTILSAVLAILFRPKFMNFDSLKPISNIPMRDNDFNLSKDLFFDTFYRNHYYINNKASLKELSVSLNVSSETLTNFIFTNYGKSYTDLINSNRINYILELIKSGNYKEYTIEGLAKMSGFNTRHHLYKCFKKYQGGSPSSYIQNLN
jgi:AraC-like DNA-binding protein